MGGGGAGDAAFPRGRVAAPTLRVLHVQKVAGLGGAERHLLVLLPQLRARGLDVRMVTLATADAARFVVPLREAGVPVTEVPAGFDVSARVVRALCREIAGFRPDIVHTHLIHADTHGQTAARLLGVPGVSSVHSTQRFYVRAPYRTAARLAGRLARRTIAISEHVGRFVASAGLAPRDRIRVVPYGIPADGWQLSGAERDAARARLGIASGAFVVGFASRLITGKGHAFFLDAVDRARAELPGLRVLLAGDGPLRPALAAECARRFDDGLVRLLGFVHDVRAFMNACDALAFLTMPALGEGFGLAALEAMAAGRPVIATRVGALPEVVVDGTTGLVVTPGDVAMLARALVTLGRDATLRAQLGDAARHRAEQAFGADVMVERMLRVYAEVA